MELEAETKNILLLPHPWFKLIVNQSEINNTINIDARKKKKKKQFGRRTKKISPNIFYLPKYHDLISKFHVKIVKFGQF